MNKMLIVPDIHGRDFWEEPVEKTLKETEDDIIFLGDYLDPYPYEFEGTDVDYREVAIDNFKKILELKKQYPDRITLLLGNHDLSYIWPFICECRRDRKNYQKICKLFEDNISDFKLADEIKVNGKHFIFSHAGIGKKYADRCFGEEYNEDNVVSLFNEHLGKQTYGIMDSLGYYDDYRGWGGFDYPSLVWADARGWIDGLQEGIGINVVGHTQFIRQINYNDKYYFLDCQKCAYLDSEGNIRDYGTDKIIEKEKN